ncbi:NAD-binding protein [Thermicanus aegyptius]|uniref:NAD-binding protein n=1 Tax=Thermicanus aegyptius TaxID=94009 RepID=UPI000415F5E9|nr:NAD-binding protein [Thermicanus aegyptius]
MLGKTTIHFGEIGASSQEKLVINLLLGITVLGISEVLLLAEKINLDRELVMQMMSESALSSPLLAIKKEQPVLKEHFPSAFALKWMAKDLALAVEAADQLQTELPLTATAFTHFQSARGTGKVTWMFPASICT